jgi:pimeloyl-ACP methyl ester carboxylesterase
LQPLSPIRREVVVHGHTVVADVHLPPDDPRPPVVFLHGIMASLEIATDLFVDPATESWISLSLPGHHPGRLPPACDHADLDEDFFSTLYESSLLQLIGPRRVIASGWSTGGFAALNLAIRQPQRVAAVASLAGFASGQRVTGMMRWLVWLARQPLGHRLVALGMRATAALPSGYRILMGLLAADGRAASWMPPDVVQSFSTAFAHSEPEAMATVLACLWSLDITDRLGEIHAPAWIAGGGLDSTIPRAETERLAAAIPGATLRVYEKGGHLFFSEWPRHREEFAAWRRSL